MNGQSGWTPGSDTTLYDILLAQSKTIPTEYSAVVDRRFWELLDDI